MAALTLNNDSRADVFLEAATKWEASGFDCCKIVISHEVFGLSANKKFYAIFR